MIVDRAPPTTMIVVLGHVEHSLARHIATAKHILEKRENVFAVVGPAEGDDQQCVIRVRHSATARTFRRAADFPKLSAAKLVVQWADLVFDCNPREQSRLADAKPFFGLKLVVFHRPPRHPENRCDLVARAAKTRKAHNLPLP